MIDPLDAVRAVGALDHDADAGARARARARVLDPPPRRRLRGVGTGLAICALTACAVGYVAVGPGEQADRAADDPPAATSAAPPLATPPSLFPAAGQFLYVRSRGAYRSCSQGEGAVRCELGREREREIWLSPTEDGRLRQDDGGVPEDIGRASLVIGNRHFTRSELLAYHPTGAELLRELQDGREPGQGGATATYPYVQITDALREGLAPPAVRAALIDALGRTPGVRALGPARDRLGRAGVAFARDQDGLREWALVDPERLTLLEERETIAEETADVTRELAGFHVGDQVGGSVYLERAVVDSDHAHP